MTFTQTVIYAIMCVGCVALGWVLRSLSHLQDARTTHAFFGLDRPVLREEATQDLAERSGEDEDDD